MKAGQAEAATPYYNNAIVEDMLYQTHQKLIHEQLQNSPAVVDAILLFKVPHPYLACCGISLRVVAQTDSRLVLSLPSV